MSLSFFLTFGYRSVLCIKWFSGVQNSMYRVNDRRVQVWRDEVVDIDVDRHGADLSAGRGHLAGITSYSTLSIPQDSYITYTKVIHSY